MGVWAWLPTSATKDVSSHDRAPELLLLDACIQAPVLYIDATMFKKSAVGVVVVVAVLVEV